MLDLTPHLLNGISLGLMFALIALGFMLIVGVMEVINLAHGSLFALGAYFAVFIMGLNLGVGIEARYAAAFLLAPLGVAPHAVDIRSDRGHIHAMTRTRRHFRPRPWRRFKR